MLASAKELQLESLALRSDSLSTSEVEHNKYGVLGDFDSALARCPVGPSQPAVSFLFLSLSFFLIAGFRLETDPQARLHLFKLKEVEKAQEA